MWECKVENKFLRMSTIYKLFFPKGIYTLHVIWQDRKNSFIHQILIEYFLCVIVGTRITEEKKAKTSSHRGYILEVTSLRERVIEVFRDKVTFLQ